MRSICAYAALLIRQPTVPSVIFASSAAADCNKVQDCEEIRWVMRTDLQAGVTGDISLKDVRIFDPLLCEVSQVLQRARRIYCASTTPGTTLNIKNIGRICALGRDVQYLEAHRWQHRKASFVDSSGCVVAFNDLRRKPEVTAVTRSRDRVQFCDASFCAAPPFSLLSRMLCLVSRSLTYLTIFQLSKLCNTG